MPQQSPFKKIKQPDLININVPISKGISSGFSSATDTSKAVQNNLICLLLTNRGERVFSDFGTSIRQLTFDPNDETLESDIINEVKRSVKQWLPYIEVKETKVSFNDQERKFNVFVRYIETETNYENTLNILIP